MEFNFKLLIILIILFLGVTLIFINEGIPYWVQNLERKSTNIWNFGIVTMSVITIIIYFYK